MKSVVFMVHGLLGGGTQKYVREVAIALAQEDVNVSVILLCSQEKFHLAKVGTYPFKLYFINQSDLINVQVQSFSSIIDDVSKEIGVDGVFSNCFGAYKILSKQKVIPSSKQYYVIHADYYSMYYKRFNIFRNFEMSIRYRKLFNGRNIICVSNGVCNNLKGRIGVRERQCYVIPAPVNLAQIKKSAQEYSRDVHLPKKYVVVVGRLTEGKRVDLAIELLKYLDEEIGLVVIGEGNILPKLKVKASMFENRVHFLGHLENPYGIISNALCLVSMSRSEGFSLVLVEAMALGVIPLSVSSAGPKDILSKKFPLCLIEDSDNCVYYMSERIKNLPSYDKYDLNKEAEQYDIINISNKYIDSISGLGYE